MTESINELRCCQTVWGGFIPTKFSVCSSDVTDLVPPDPIYILSSRMSYLPVVAVDAINTFRTSALDFNNMNSDVWFEYGECPLKSNLPIGVLFDMVYKGSVSDFPWHIIIHYSSFPRDQIIRCGSKDLAYRHYAHSMKQALYLLTGSTRVFNEMTGAKQDQLWESLCSGNRGQFEAVARHLRPSPDSARLLPIRLISANSHRTIQKNIPVYMPTSSPPVLTTLQYVLDLCGDELRARDAMLSSQSQEGVKKEVKELSHDITDTAEQSAENRSKLSEYLINGIQVPSETPLYPLWSLLAHADLF
eukprot:CAMPEP_0182430904 /NCGR_PEP_ID=MMETSP1167-20130531/44680_1 /TAXON_ID=2988 /ORGANISM="Mallomonas Sp, Strain CCMP3275" /LENGTH=303 /DNA_ID=CAMNT_0024616581 /DNA_START=107 /DNA_END=1015 /DNA_ORIENTATION=+